MINIDEILIIGLINEDYFANELKKLRFMNLRTLNVFLMI
jgi:hypothetical protein